MWTAAFKKLYLVHSWILCPECPTYTEIFFFCFLKSHVFFRGIWFLTSLIILNPKSIDYRIYNTKITLTIRGETWLHFDFWLFFWRSEDLSQQLLDIVLSTSFRLYSRCICKLGIAQGLFWIKTLMPLANNQFCQILEVRNDCS